MSRTQINIIINFNRLLLTKITLKQQYVLLIDYQHCIQPQHSLHVLVLVTGCCELVSVIPRLRKVSSYSQLSKYYQSLLFDLTEAASGPGSGLGSVLVMSRWYFTLKSGDMLMTSVVGVASRRCSFFGTVEFLVVLTAYDMTVLEYWDGVCR